MLPFTTMSHSRSSFDSQSMCTTHSYTHWSYNTYTFTHPLEIQYIHSNNRLSFYPLDAQHYACYYNACTLSREKEQLERELMNTMQMVDKISLGQATLPHSQESKTSNILS